MSYLCGINLKSNSYEYYLRREGQGIDKSVLQTKVLLYPPQEVLDTFWPLYNSVINQIQTKTTEIKCLGDVRDILLPKLMSGELKINEIDC